MAKITQIKNKSGDSVMPIADARGVVVGNEFLDDVLAGMQKVIDKLKNQSYVTNEELLNALASIDTSSVSIEYDTEADVSGSTLRLSSNRTSRSTISIDGKVNNSTLKL